MAVEKSRALRFMDRRDESFLIAFPLVGIVLVLAYQAMGAPGMEKRPIYLWAEFATGLLFLDLVHITFTVVAILGLPELRRWNRQASSPPLPFFRRFWPRVLLAGAIGALICTTPRLWIKEGAAATFFVALYLWVDTLVSTHHNLAQTRGISFLYNSVLKKTQLFTPEQQRAAARLEKRDKALYAALIFVDFLATYAFLAILGELRLARWTQYAVGASFAASNALVIAILVNGQRYPHQEKTLKGYYLLRMLMYCIRPFSLQARWLTAASHGTEYFMIVRNMIRNSAVSDRRRRAIYAAMAAFAVSFAALMTYSHSSIIELLGHKPPYGVMLALTLFGFGFRYAHFQMDRILYRMSDPKTRAVVGPLLVSVPSRAALPRRLSGGQRPRGSLSLAPGESPASARARPHRR